MVGDKTIYQVMGELNESIAAGTEGKYGYTMAGAVTGATYPAQIQNLRATLNKTFFLVPGYGAQGGGGADVAGAFDANGAGAIVNSSRGLIAAWQKEGCAAEDFAGAARREALRMKEDITKYL